MTPLKAEDIMVNIIADVGAGGKLWGWSGYSRSRSAGAKRGACLSLKPCEAREGDAPWNAFWMS